MKFTVNGMEINITVKCAYTTTKEATTGFMNELSILYHERAELKERLNAENPKPYYIGEHGTIAQAKRTGDEIFDQLAKMGVYDYLN